MIIARPGVAVVACSVVAALAATLTACTATPDPAGRSTGPTRSSTAVPSPPVTPPVITTSARIAVGEARGPDLPRVARYGGTTVVAYTDTVRGVTASGTVRWTFRLPATVRDPYALQAVVDGDTTVLTWADPIDVRIRAVDTATGRLRWRGRSSNATSVAGTVLVTRCTNIDTGCSVSALAPRSGAVRWTRAVAGTPYVFLPGARSRIEAQAPGRAAVVEVSDPGPTARRPRLPAYDYATGRSRTLDVPAAPVYRAGDTLVAVADDQDATDGCIASVVAADLGTGRRMWTRAFPVADIASVPTGRECRSLDAGQPAAGLLALRPKDGRPVVLELSTGRYDRPAGSVTGSVVARYRDLTFVVTGESNDERLLAVRPGNRTMWSIDYYTGYGTTPRIVRGRLVVGIAGCGNDCSVLDPGTGLVLGTVDSRVIDAGADWVATWDNTVVRVYTVR